MDTPTIIQDEEKGFYNEFPPELTQEPYLIVGVIGNDLLPQNIRREPFRDAQPNQGRRIFSYATRKEYLPNPKKPKTDSIYEFLQPDQTFVRADWLNKVRHNTPSVICFIETPESLFGPDHDAVPQFESIQSILNTRHIKMVVVIATHSPQTISTTDSYNSFRKRISLDALLFFNLSDVRGSLTILSKALSDLSFTYYKEIEHLYKTTAQTAKVPWKAAVSYFKAGFISEVREQKAENYKNSTRLYSKALSSMIELLRVEEQRFYKSSNIVATKELIGWIIFRMVHIYEKNSQFDKIIELFEDFKKQCTKCVGVDQFRCTHLRWIAKIHHLLAVVHSRSHPNKNDALLYSYAAAIYYTSAYHSLSNLYSAEDGQEYIKYLPSNCTPDIYFDCALRQYFYCLLKITEDGSKMKSLDEMYKHIVGLYLYKPKAQRSKSWWEMPVFLKLLAQFHTPQPIPHFLTAVIQTYHDESLQPSYKTLFLKEVFTALSESSFVLTPLKVTAPGLECFVSFTSPTVIIGTTATLTIDIENNLPSLPLHTIHLTFNDRHDNLSIPTRSPLPHTLRLTSTITPRKLGILRVLSITFQTAATRSITILPKTPLSVTKTTLSDAKNYGRILTDVSPPCQITVVARRAAITLSFQHSNTAVFGESLPISINITNNEHYALSGVRVTFEGLGAELASTTIGNVGVDQVVSSVVFLSFKVVGEVMGEIVVSYIGLNGNGTLRKSLRFVVKNAFSHNTVPVEHDRGYLVGLKNTCGIPIVIDGVLALDVVNVKKDIILSDECPCEFICPHSVRDIPVSVKWHRKDRCVESDQIVYGETHFIVEKRNVKLTPIGLVIDAQNVVEVGSVFHVSATISNNTIVSQSLRIAVAKDQQFVVCGDVTKKVELETGERLVVEYDFICCVPGQHNTPTITVETKDHFISKSSMLLALPVFHETQLYPTAVMTNM
ncbi:Trafficking protein particle complex subunit 11 domain-containing protein [Entamoeba marina]